MTPPDAPDAPRGHCWHSDGIVLTSYPEQYPETCCHCGARRTRSYRFVTEGHGKFDPSRETEVTYSGGDSPCDPEGASRPGEPQP